MIPHLLEKGEAEIARFASLPRGLLALDFDGTLAPIAPTPESARIDPAAARALARVAALDPAVSVAVVSGRRIADLAKQVPRVGLLIGLHGLEIQIGDRPARLRADVRASDAALDRLRPRLGELAKIGARIEDKTHSIALHVRGLREADAARALAQFESLVEEERSSGAPLECMRGHAVLEARPTAAGKHRAIAEIREQLGVVPLLFAGDDVTDEEVFRAFPGELTVAVMDPPRSTAARFFLRSPSEIAAMLDRFCELRGRTMC